MSGIQGPFTITKFLGASVTQVQSNAGWQEQISSLRVELIEDVRNGDRFISPETGTPISFHFEGFRFDGFVQQWGESKNASVFPSYFVQLSSPVEILEAVQLVLDAYRGVNLVCPNLLNVFGYLEGAGETFGGSGKNEAGISWYKIQSALEAIQSGTTDFGPGIEFKGHKYVVDFGSIPPVPDFYRLSEGAFTSLHQAIRRVFEDAGHDFIVQLRISEDGGPHTIFFKTHSRLTQVPPGQIAAFVEGKENIVSFEQGEELRNDVTCGVILGGEEESCIGMPESGDGSVIWQYWGYQQNPILIPFALEGNPPIVESAGYGNNHTAILNASPISGIIGSLSYVCSVFEMRLAMVDFDSWATFIARKRPEVAEMLGLEVTPSIFGKGAFTANIESMYADNAMAINPFSDPFESPALFALQQIYEFVKTQAETYLGKQFVVRIPFYLKYYFEEETNRLMYNVSVSTEGYYPDYLGPGNSGPLGLNFYNFNSFMSNSGKFSPFLKFSGPGIQNANLNSRNASDMVIQDYEIFMRCNVDSRIIFTPAPAILCTISEGLFNLPPDPLGGIEDIAWLLDMDPADLAVVVAQNNGEFPIKIHPAPFSPSGAAICIKNNQYTYGPWTKIGVPGRVRVEQNTNLTPWNYGGFENMRLAAEAQLADIGSTLQVEGSGQVTFTGAPDISLGDHLNGVGPVVTAVDISAGSQGVITTYRMRSQTPTYGSFSKQNAERMRRLGFAAQEMRYNMRALFDRLRDHQRIATTANWAYYRNNVSRAIKDEQSTTVFHAFLTRNEAGHMVPHVSAKTFPGALGASNAHDPDKFKATASMGVDGFFRPVSTDTSHDTLSHFETPHSDVANGVKGSDFNPFKEGTDIKWAANGKDFKGYFTASERDGISEDMKDVRALAHRGPMIMTGWGREISGLPVPNLLDNPDAKIEDMTDTYLDDHMKKSDRWKTGPIDLRWDKWRKVWGFPGLLLGTYQGNNEVKLFKVDDIIEVEPYFYSSPSDIAVGAKVGLGYYAITNKWYIIQVIC